MERKIVGDYAPGISKFDGCNASLFAVCVQTGPDYSPQYAVYQALAPAFELGNKRAAVAEWVADRGSKMRYDEAVRFFPTLKRENYRA